jgi:glutaminyl-peptide cyclotransferase
LKRFLTFPRWLVFLLALLLLFVGGYEIISVALANRKAEQLIPQVISVLPHDPNSFTEGLLWHNGFLYESSGLYGVSNLKKVDLHTGAVLQRAEDPTQVFGEGLALNGNELFQLTWREQTGYVYDLDTLNQLRNFSYEGEGWGLCFDGKYFFMSNGSASIFKRDPKTFAVIGSVQVLQDGKPINQLNELECVGNSIYANVWRTDTILQVNKTNGKVTGVIDASGLMTPDELAQAGPDGVLNGIAYDPVDKVFLITGKLWHKLFEVKFVPKGNN